MKRILWTFSLLVAPVFAQLTPEQRAEDFRHLAGLYAKQYAPYEWKRQLFGFDALDIGPWLDRVAKSRDDLDFYEICVEYVASLHDTHDSYSLPSNFVASLGFSVDIYDGKVLIDSISRIQLPSADFPFGIGDELVSVDGKDVGLLIQEFSKYAIQGNPLSTRRIAAARLVTRPQSRMPHAPDLGERATVVIRRQNDELETYSIPWIKTGVPLNAGPVPSPKSAGRVNQAGEAIPEYLKTWMELQYSAAPEPHGVLGYGARTPIFALPANFIQRLGQTPDHFFISGTFEAEGFKIGYIRIPNYGTLEPPVLQQFEKEIEFFEQNTDGLVVDQMRNTGGFLCFGENIVARLTPYTFRATGFLLRATWQRVNSFYASLISAQQQNAPQWIIDLYQALLNDISTAYSENRGTTGSLPLCTASLDRPPATGQNGKVIAYTKPLLMIVDEFSTSTADSVPAMLQDARRAVIFGMRTNGAGGTNATFAAGAYSQGTTGMTLGLMTRMDPAITSDFPAAPFIENIGVRPAIEVDYMTRENLLQRGRPFVQAFTAAIVSHIRANR